MIYLDKHIENEELFVELLEKTRHIVLRELGGKTSLSPNDFERLVFESMILAAKKTAFEDCVRLTGPHDFPDIIAKKYFGAEVKMTKENKWTSLGNSVQESTRDRDVKRIYLFFGKLGGQIDIKFRRYQDCMVDIAVTHSPRYRINMDLPPGSSIFHKMQISYDRLRKNNPLRQFKSYYMEQLKEGEELWWIDPQGESAISPVIKPYRTIHPQAKKEIKARMMILFPEIFIQNSSSKYERAAAYLISTYNLVLPSFRDEFSAGGRAVVMIQNKKYKLPKVYKKLFELAPLIQKMIHSINKEELFQYWKTEKIEKDRLGQWKLLLDEKATGLPKVLSASDIFEAGLTF